MTQAALSFHHLKHMNLTARESLRVRVKDKPIAILADEGCLWITTPHNTADYILLSGQRMKLDLPGEIVIEALQDSLLTLEETGDEMHVPTEKDLTPAFKVLLS